MTPGSFSPCRPRSAVLVVLAAALTAVVGCRNETPATSVHEAVRSGNAAEVRRLLDAGADASAADQSGVTPLLLATLEGHLEVVRLLIDKGADLNTETRLPGRLLADVGAPVRGSDRVEATPLLIAAFKGDAALVDLMLERGADVNLGTVDGITPLFVAAFAGNAAMVKRLLDAGGQVNPAADRGRPPLLAAIEQKNYEMVGQLLRAGAGTNAVFDDGRDALQIAVAEQDEELLRILRLHGMRPAGDKIGADAIIDTTGANTQLPHPVDEKLQLLLPSRLQPRGIALDLQRRRIYWAEFVGDRIRSADLDGRTLKSVIEDVDGPIGVAIDAVRQTIFWTSDASYPRRISRAGFDGKSIEVLAQGPSVNRPRAIAVDADHGEVVWTEAVSGRLLKAAVDGTEVKEIFSSGISSVADRPDREAFRSLGVAIAAKTRQLYWTEVTMDRLTQADLVSTGSPELTRRHILTVADGVQFPVGVAVDERAGVVYWTDIGRQAVYRAGLDGNNVASILGRDDGLVEPYGIALDIERGKLYWTDASRDLIGRANIDGTAVEERSLHDDDPFAPRRNPRGCLATVFAAGQRYLADAVQSMAVCLDKVDALKAVKRGDSDAAKAASTCIGQLSRWDPLVRELRRTLDAECGGSDWRSTVSASANPLVASCGSRNDSTYQQWLDCTVRKHREAAEGLLARRYLRAVEWLDEVRPFIVARAGKEAADGPAAAGVDALDAMRSRLMPTAAKMTVLTGLPATGQTTSYAAVTTDGSSEMTPVADDGAVGAGRPAAFRDNRDGTVTDLHTGLVWEKKCDGCGNAHDAALELPWDGDGEKTTIWDWLADVNDEGSDGFAGRSDWRLPNVKELQTIIDYERFNPAVSRAFDGDLCGLGCTDLADPQCSCTRMSAYWTSTTFPGSSSRAIVAAFHLGLISERPKSELAYVRAVRGGTLPPSP